MLLSFIARHSTLIMPVCAIVGFVFPNLSNAVLVYLPQILFFLMFFTLLGIDQYALLKRIATSYVWVFAVLQSAGMSLVLVLISYALGVRGDLLLAIAGLGATAPPYSGVEHWSMRWGLMHNWRRQNYRGYAGMPATLLGVLWLFGGKDAHLDLATYVQRWCTLFCLCYLRCWHAASLLLLFCHVIIPKLGSLIFYYCCYFHWD